MRKKNLFTNLMGQIINGISLQLAQGWLYRIGWRVIFCWQHKGGGVCLMEDECCTYISELVSWHLNKIKEHPKWVTGSILMHGLQTWSLVKEVFWFIPQTCCGIYSFCNLHLACFCVFTSSGLMKTISVMVIIYVYIIIRRREPIRKLINMAFCRNCQ